MAGLVMLQRSIGHTNERQVWAGRVAKGDYSSQLCTVRYC